MAKGTVEFRYDLENDVVIATPRWTLATSAEVMRWYELHVSYFGGRFRSPKSLITRNDAFDVVPQVAALWGSYRAKLHETHVKSSISVNSNPRVRLTTNTSGVRYGIGAIETKTVEEAIAAIVAARAAMIEEEARSTRPSSLRMTAVTPAAEVMPPRSTKG
jgi:hypothetical protein